jgi:chromosome partitioning protein
MSELQTKILGIGHTKGGVGKSTLAVNMAVAAKGHGLKVLLVDLDPVQRSTTKWAAVRREQQDEGRELISVPCVAMEGKAYRDLREVAPDYDLVVADAGGFDALPLRGLLMAADVLVMPANTSAFEMWEFERMHELIEQANSFRVESGELDAWVLLNQVGVTGGAKEASESRGFLEDDGFRALDTVIHARKAFRRGAEVGLSVLEQQGRFRDPKAIAEVDRAFTEIAEQLLGLHLPR